MRYLRREIKRCNAVISSASIRNEPIFAETDLAHTPNGRRLVSVSISLVTSILSPIKAVGMLQALSTT